MISATIEKLIDQVILDRIAGPAGQSFSAYDITRDVRKLTTEIFYHNDAKDYIHAKLQDSKMFDQTNIGVGYFVYTRNTNQPATIQQAVVVTNPSPATAVNVQFPVCNLVGKARKAFNQVMGKALSTKGFALTNNTLKKSVQRTPDARGTLSIPKDMVKGLGLSPGDQAQARIGKHNNQLLVIPWTTGAHAIKGYDALYTVDRSGNIRITKATLQKAGIKNNVVTFEHSNNRIVVE